MMDRTIANAWNGEDYAGNYGWVARWAPHYLGGTGFYVFDPNGVLEWEARIDDYAPDAVIRSMWKATKNAADSRLRMKASAR